MEKTPSERSILDVLNSGTLTEAQTADHKLVLNDQHITCLFSSDQRSIKSPTLAATRKLYLSQNLVQSLSGLENFPVLEHLSLSYNQILDVEELFHHGERLRLTLEHLSVRGNFLETHPDHRGLILRYFRNLKHLDGTEIVSQTRQILASAPALEKKLIPLARQLRAMYDRVKSVLSAIELTLEVKLSKEARHEVPPVLDMRIYASALLDVARKMDKFIAAVTDLGKESDPLQRLSRLLACCEDTVEVAETEEDTVVAKRLFEDTVAALRKGGNYDLERFLCYQILKSDRDLLETLFSQLDQDNGGIPWTHTRHMEAAVELLLKGSYAVNYADLDLFSHFRKLSLAGEESEPEICSSRPQAGKKIRLRDSGQFSSRLPALSSRIREDSSQRSSLAGRFPVFPLNPEYLDAITEAITGQVGKVKSTYTDLARSLRQNYPEAYHDLFGAYTIPWLDLGVPEKTQWMAASLEAQQKGVEMLTDMVRKQLARKFLTKLRQAADRQRLREELLARIAQNQADRAGRAGLGRLRDYVRVQHDSEQKSVDALALSRKRHIFGGLREELSRESQDSEKAATDTLSRRLAVKSINGFRLAAEEAAKKALAIRRLTDSRLLRYCVGKWRSAATAVGEKLGDQITLDRTINRSTAANTTGQEGTATIFVPHDDTYTVTEEDAIIAEQKRRAEVEREDYIKGLEEKCRQCVRDTERSYRSILEEMRMGQTKKAGTTICSVGCKKRLPAYLVQKRLPRSLSIAHRATTLAAVAKKV